MMEGRAVILSVVIMTLLMGQIQAEPTLCCPNLSARTAYITCRMGGASDATCLTRTGCIGVSGDTCPPGYPDDILKNPGDAVNEYCKLGCAFSVCGAMTALKNSDANGIWNGAAEQCTNACSTLCNKGSLTTVKSA
ncbi:unnamed protein product [Thlaspi arvense]|uniref:Acidic protein n=1 Tax=Thlaspi arvense TaxID=13288 RepID=A0AAU9RUT3_THLAR|nr:unnamed protein product [Thlaspi arvense]